MRTVCFAILILAVACKEEQKPTPAPKALPPSEVKKPAPQLRQFSPAVENAVPAPSTQPVITPAGGINTAAEYEAKAFDLMDKITAVFAANGTNCDKLAANLERFVAQNKDALAATDQFEAANPSAEDDLEPKLQAKAKQFVQNMNVSMQACQNHEGVKAALAKLPD